MKFTMETEQEDCLSFLDISVSRTDNHFSTRVYRKPTFTGLGLNFYSFCSFKFKLNSCKTLLHRAYNICSDWTKFHSEMTFLTEYFGDNCYPPLGVLFANMYMAKVGEITFTDQQKPTI